MTQNIDFTPLCDFLKSAINMPDIEISIVWPENAKRPTIVCPNLIEHCGPFKAAMKDVALFAFAGSPFGGANGGGVWLSINLYYETHSGGTNSVQVTDAWYYEHSNEWVFKPANQK